MNKHLLNSGLSLGMLIGLSYYLVSDSMFVLLPHIIVLSMLFGASTYIYFKK